MSFHLSHDCYNRWSTLKLAQGQDCWIASDGHFDLINLIFDAESHACQFQLILPTNYSLVHVRQ